MECLTFLDRLDKHTPQPAYVLHGDEPFLKALARDGVRRLVLGDADPGFASSEHAGDKATWAAVLDDLMTLPMLAPRRLVAVTEADPFVSRERGKLEKLFTDRAKGAAPTGVLVLDVKAWAATTKLAKLTPDPWLIVCDTPKSHALAPWCVSWCKSKYGKTLAAPAARLLVELIGPHMGQLDMELDKLAVYAGASDQVETRDVDALVGSRQAENTWRLFTLIAAGKAGEALSFLERLLDQGKAPMELLGGFGYRLRPAAMAGRLAAQGVPLGEAMKRAGVPYPALQETEQQIRQLGRARLDRLFDWLLEADQGMKGGSQLTPRQLMERLVVNLARERR
ncbi:MAG: DNA polymerase III subunit delta [Gemmataceae bacterium]